MKSFSVITLLFTVVSLVSAHTEYSFALKHQYARRAAHKHHKRNIESPVKRQNPCQFPTDVGLVPVTPGAQNAGWAMSPDQPCKPNNYCPYACPPGRGLIRNGVNFQDKLWP